MKVKHKLLLGLMVLVISPLVMSDEVPKTHMQLHDDQGMRIQQPRTVYDDMKKSKEGMSPRRFKSKYNYAGINPKTSHLSTLSNDALETPVPQLPTLPKP